MQSRVWYAHDLVVSQEPETKKGQSAVAAAARQALESTKSMPPSKPRARWGLWVAGASLAGAAATALLIPFEQDAAEPQLSIASEQPPVTASLDEAPGSKDLATEEAVAQKVAATGQEQNVSPPEADKEPVQASHENPGDRPPHVARYTAIDTGTLTTGSTSRAADLHASPFAGAPVQPSGNVGELEPESLAPEIEVVEVDRDGSVPQTEDGLGRAKSAPRRTAVQSRVRRKPAAAQQSVEYFTTGDCAMPPWAWRVFGFTEPAKKKPGCGS